MRQCAALEMQGQVDNGAHPALVEVSTALDERRLIQAVTTQGMGPTMLFLLDIQPLPRRT